MAGFFILYFYFLLKGKFRALGSVGSDICSGLEKFMKVSYS